MQDASKQYNKLVNLLSSSNKVIGLWLSGSRAKGYHDERSDYDLWVIVKDKSDIPTLEKGVRKLNLDPDIGTVFKTLDELKKYSRWGRHDFWIRYSFTDTKALLDRTGEVQKVIDKIGTFPKDKQRGLIKGALGAYQNSLYRSLKAFYRNQKFAALIGAGQSIEHLLTAVFALHKRFKPYNSYLEKEIDKLNLFGDLRSNFMERLLKIITTAEPEAQLRMKQDMEKVFKKNGFPESFDEWDETFAGFLKKYCP